VVRSDSVSAVFLRRCMKCRNARLPTKAVEYPAVRRDLVLPRNVEYVNHESDK